LFVRTGPDGKNWRFTARPDVAALPRAEGGQEVSESEIEAAVETTFALERDLQAALRRNIGQLEAGLKIIDGGSERVTEAGKIDITAQDKDGDSVVVELKAGEARPEAVAQILAYMSALAESDHKPVRGILVAGDFHKRVVLAARAVKNLELKRYSFQFLFKTEA
jgi:endonuclease